MASFKSHPFFYTSLLLAGALTAGQAWLLYSQRAAAQKVSAEIAQKKQTLDSFSFQKPFASRENLSAVEADRLKAEKTRDEIRTSLRATGEVAEKIAAATVPGSPTDAYFDIANFVERLRAQARTANVGFSAENRFGFSAYTSTGPVSDLIAPVFQQRQYAEYLIGALLNSKNPPKEFVGLLRERPLTAAQKRQIEEAISSGQTVPAFGEGVGSADYFTIDPRTSARVPNFVETSPFRITFTGYTATLRAFLNELALFKIPAVVRSVEVESLNQGTKQSAPAANSHNAFGGLFGGQDTAVSAADAVKPIVDQTESRFIVTIEIISLVDKNAAAPANTP